MSALTDELRNIVLQSATCTTSELERAKLLGFLVKVDELVAATKAIADEAEAMVEWAQGSSYVCWDVEDLDELPAVRNCLRNF